MIVIIEMVNIHKARPWYNELLLKMVTFYADILLLLFLLVTSSGYSVAVTVRSMKGKESINK